MNRLKYILWDPIKGIELGFFTIHFYSLMFVLAFLCGWGIMNQIYDTEKVDKKHLDSLLLYTVLGTLIGARLGQVFFYDLPYFKNHWMEALLPIRERQDTYFMGIFKDYEFIGYRGLASHGATLGLILSSWLYSKRILHKPFLWICDRICIPVALGGMFVRIGNFFNSEIVGKPKDLPWAVKFMQMDEEYGEIVPRHPAQLYESLGYLCIFLIIYFIYRKTNKKYYLGYMFGLFFTLLWSVRFLTEFIKEPQGHEILYTSMLNTGQLLSIPFIIIGLFLMATGGKRKFNLP
ncbi:prolipoprotein diacylglyceryl transferase [Bacteroidetes bacterium endosymbiont of Geopemphigus sp.]|uniref:prolipoprotein diacylglyceryl transferase n=1 Tax=Bacteroidetes bacterium endosymbiont of Geopemphigus sp. TaxID=2047937 RepID=UPI000CD17ACD|nr:prolipoprotein diacylglyceryl transferase [Bacteroidetes bacterium endosymbiont of Geopemphigus sp.]